MNTLRNILFGLKILTFYSCSTGYKNQGDAVYFKRWNEGSGQYKDKIEADPNSFTILRFDTYAKDDKTVFYNGEKIIGADAKTFEALGEYDGRDRNFGWHGKDTIKTSNGPTFKLINSYYSADEHDAFFVASPLKMDYPKKFKFVYGEGDDECWTTDGEYYYYKNYKVPSDDYANVKIYPKSGGISNDTHWAYFCDRKLNYDIDGKKVVDTIDIATFLVTGFIECRDKYSCFNVYHGRKQCRE